MGKAARGAKLRAKRRAKEHALQMQEIAADRVETLELQADDRLFVIDTDAAPVEGAVAKPNKKRERERASVKEKEQIQKLISKHTALQLEQMAAKGRPLAKAAKAAKAGSSVRLAPTLRKTRSTRKRDLQIWGDDAQTAVASKKEAKRGPGSAAGGTAPPHSSIHGAAASKRAFQPAYAASKESDKPSSVSIDVAKSGQSYNPDKLLHNKVLQDAVKVEEARLKAKEDKAALISPGLSAETKALLIADSDSESDSDEDENENENENDSGDNEKTVPVVTRDGKMTRAQRNRQKRVRAEQKEARRRKRARKEQAAVGEAKTIIKTLKVSDAEHEQKKRELEAVKAKTARPKGSNLWDQLTKDNPLAAPSLPVALPKDATGSLRTLRPKGSLLTDRLLSFQDRDMMPKKQLRVKTRVEGKKRRKVKSRIRVHGKGHDISKTSGILG